jgi:hypothetical protein
MVLALAGCGAGGEAFDAGAPASTAAAASTSTAAPAPAPSTSAPAPPATSPAAATSTTRRAPAATVALGPEWTQQDGWVLIEAVAAGDPATLLRDLRALGLRDGVAVGRVVNGWLPVASFESAQRLDSLQFVRPTGAGTG